MKTFIGKSSIVRKIWGTTDITLFIFAGAAAEFALNKQVDWLYHTGKLPANPIGRLFSTVQYAQQIIFTDESKSYAAIERINKIHQAVESSRKTTIPDAAYKDVLFMLIYYSISSFELLERKMTAEEKDEVVQTFRGIGIRMHLQDIPETYSAWSATYQKHLRQNLENSFFTKDLYKQYKKHLGAFRYFILIEVQRLLVSPYVNKLLQLGSPVVADKFVGLYRIIRKTGLHNWLVRLLVPHIFRPQLSLMNQVNVKQLQMKPVNV
jgi:uncharacterized protein (DUF2236 family)